MPKIRRSPRTRNNNIKNIKINYIAVIVLFVTVIAMLIGILMHKENQKKAKEAELIAQIEEERKQYLLFQEEEQAKKELENEIEENKKDTIIRIVSVGDILCEDTIIEDAYNKDTGEYDFSHIFRNVKNHTEKADLTLGMLETNFVNGEKYSGTGKYNSPRELAKELKNIGIDILHTANNHSLDYGIEGIKSTIDYLEELEIETLGTYRTKEESENVLIKDVQGIKIALLSYTYGTNVSASEENSFCVNITNKDKIKSDITKAREQNVEFIFVHMHWGDVDTSVPNEEQKDLANFLFENGANFVLGSHPASLQPMEVRKNEYGNNVFIAYSTGNFISASKYKYSNIEMVLNIEITKKGETGETYLSRVTYEPIYLLDRGIGAEERYTLLNIKEEIAKYENEEENRVDQATYTELKQAIENIEKLIGKE